MINLILLIIFIVCFMICLIFCLYYMRKVNNMEVRINEIIDKLDAKQRQIYAITDEMEEWGEVIISLRNILYRW